MAAITVYGTPGCPGCRLTVQSAQAQGVEVRYVDLATDVTALEHVRALGFSQAPVVECEGSSWSGFRPDLITQIATR